MEDLLVNGQSCGIIAGGTFLRRRDEPVARQPQPPGATMRERQIVTFILCLSVIALSSACGRLFGGEAEAPGPASFEPAIQPAAAPTETVATPTLAEIATVEPTLAPPTETIPPTVEPQPTVIRTVVISVSAAYLRSGPGMDSEIVGLAQKGAVLPVIESDEFGNWIMVELDDGSMAWVGSTVVVEGEAAVSIDTTEMQAATAESPPAADSHSGDNTAEVAPTPAAADPAVVELSPEPIAPTEPAPVQVEPTAVVTFNGESVDPAWHPCYEGQIKGSYDTWTYHVPGGAFYDRTYTYVICFDTEEAAQSAGYVRSEH